MSDLARLVAESADAADLHATAPALLLELQTELGALAATATAATERGRRPFRAPADWNRRLGMLAYGIYFGAAHSLQQLTADAARTAVAGLSDSERQQLVSNFINANAASCWSAGSTVVYTLWFGSSMFVETIPLSD